MPHFIVQETIASFLFVFLIKIFVLVQCLSFLFHGRPRGARPENSHAHLSSGRGPCVEVSQTLFAMLAGIQILVLLVVRGPGEAEGGRAVAVANKGCALTFVIWKEGENCEPRGEHRSRGLCKYIPAVEQPKREQVNAG